MFSRMFAAKPNLIKHHFQIESHILTIIRLRPINLLPMDNLACKVIVYRTNL